MNNTLQLGFFSNSQVNLIRQTEVAECGLACLAMVANYYGEDIDLASLRRRFQPSLRGTTLKSLITIADHMALSPRPVKLPLEQIDGLHMPAILHWDLNHFVVLEKVKKGQVLIHDPASQSRWYLFSELSKEPLKKDELMA